MMTEALFEDLLMRQKASGLTVRDFCANEGIIVSTYYYWLKKCSRKESVSRMFIPLTVGQDQFAAGKRNHPVKPLQACDHVDSPVLLELVFPNGTVLKVRNHLEMSFLQGLVHLYD